MKGRWALAVAVPASLLLAVQLVVIATSWSEPEASQYFPALTSLLYAISFSGFAVMGAFIVFRRPGHAIGWLLGVAGVGFLAIGALEGYAAHGLLLDPGGLPAADVAGVLTQTVWIVPFGLVPLLLLVFPTGRPLPGAWRLLAVPALGAIGLVLGPGSVLVWALRDRARDLLTESPDFEGFAAVATVQSVGTVLLGISTVGAAVALFVRWRRSDGLVRLQMKWLTLVGVLELAFTLAIVADEAFGLELGVLTDALRMLAVLAIPAAIAAAVLRYRLYDIDRIVSRTVSYAVLTALLGGVYAGMVFGSGAVLPGGSDLAVAASTLAVAALFVPLRRRVQSAVDRRFNRARYDAARTVDMFAARLRDEIDLDALEGELVDVVSRTVHPAAASLWLRGGT